MENDVLFLLCLCSQAPIVGLVGAGDNGTQQSFTAAALVLRKCAHSRYTSLRSVAEGPSCDFSAPPQQMSCTDACCRLHDMCCGGQDRTGCNKALADCLSGQPVMTVTPTRDCS